MCRGNTLRPRPVSVTDVRYRDWVCALQRKSRRGSPRWLL